MMDELEDLHMIRLRALGNIEKNKQKAWRKKRKYASILFSLLLQLLPLQLFQDHRDGNLEAAGMTVACCLHQAVPSCFQVTVPVRNIWDRGAVVRDRDPGASMESR
jgi:hypothetical protein